MLVLSLPDLNVLVSRLRAVGCVFAEDEAALLLEAAHDGAHLEHLLAQRESGLPLEHVVGWAAFAGLRLHVAPGVFVPRRRSEYLARTAAGLARTTTRLARPGYTVLDLCCGCGAVGAALVEAVPGVRLYAADIDPAAVACAKLNLPPAARVYQGDLFQALPSALLGRLDLVMASPPYVPSDAIGLLPPEARLHEPLIALDGGADGLDVVRRLVHQARCPHPRRPRRGLRPLRLHHPPRRPGLAVAARRPGHRPDQGPRHPPDRTHPLTARNS